MIVLLLSRERDLRKNIQVRNDMLSASNWPRSLQTLLDRNLTTRFQYRVMESHFVNHHPPWQRRLLWLREMATLANGKPPRKSSPTAAATGSCGSKKWYTHDRTEIHSKSAHSKMVLEVSLLVLVRCVVLASSCNLIPFHLNSPLEHFTAQSKRLGATTFLTDWWLTTLNM